MGFATTSDCFCLELKEWARYHVCLLFLFSFFRFRTVCLEWLREAWEEFPRFSHPFPH